MTPAGLVAGALALASLATAGACICPPRATELADTGFRTPEETFRSFQVFLAADLEDWEYRCFSARFKSDNQLSVMNYGEARDELFRARPWLKWFAKAEIARQWKVREGVHVIEARVAGRTVHVRLVREDSYEIYSGNVLVSDDFTDFERLIRIEDTPQGPRISVTVTPYEPRLDLRQATSFLVERTWRIDDLSEAPSSPEP